LMNDWIQTCIKTHPHCRSDEHSQLPKRVLDVGTSQDFSVRLHLSSGEQVKYAALSHRWGKENLLKTTKNTLEARKQSIDWSDLSKTFQDAITLSRLLNLRYLWIDSLCIVQDDLADWEVESSKMASIYQNSYVTISANNSFGALLGERAKRKNHSGQLDVPVPGGTLVSINARAPIDHNKFFAGSLEGAMAGFDYDYPLSTRAWCFQERLLATRVLHFTDEEIVFECKTSCECECGSISHRQYSTPLKSLYNGIIQDIFAPTSFAPNEWEGWKMIVSPYIRKDLTDPRDVLPALAGVASRVQCDKLGRYFVGLWESQLAEGLFWYTEFVNSRQPVIESAPSFSWAALAG
ncbi:HET-domain-containing protein, partial [Glonium stellatum]